MRNTIGHYIDSLSDEARDRIVTAQSWTFGRGNAADGSSCLVGHAEAVASDEGRMLPEAALCNQLVNWSLIGHDYRSTPAMRFDKLAERVGLDRAVKLVKARAASTSSRIVEGGRGERESAGVESAGVGRVGA